MSYRQQIVGDTFYWRALYSQTCQFAWQEDKSSRFNRASALALLLALRSLSSHASQVKDDYNLYIAVLVRILAKIIDDVDSDKFSMRVSCATLQCWDC